MKNLFLPVFCLFLHGCNINNETVKTAEETQKNIISKKSDDFPESLGYVSDFENTLTAQQIADLNKILSDYEAKTSNQIAIVSLDKNFTKDQFYDYALDLSNHWGIGQKDQNNGLTIIYSQKLRAIRISTGIGTEKILTDEICDQILQNEILPEFRKDNIYLGLVNGVNALMNKWN